MVSTPHAGAIAAFAGCAVLSPYRLKLAGSISLQAKTGVYQFNTMSAKHYFCSQCGIYTHHQRRSNPHQYGINVACLEGISPFDFDEVSVNDGIHHPADDKKGGGPRVAGFLRFIRRD